MKRCPECSNSYPDAERFCSSDGAALVPAESSTERATVQMPPPGPPEPPVECPVCGGKALPGEEVCSFCGARLNISETPAQPAPAPYKPTFTLGGQTGQPSPPQQHPTAQHIFDDEPPAGEEPSALRRFFAWTGYLVAAVVALAAGAWFAIHLTSTAVAPKPAAMASPAASPAVSGPVAVLATNTPVQVTGESAFDPARNVPAASKIFSDNSAAVLDTYKKALEGDSTLSDGVLATLTVNRDGSVVAGSVKTSTAINPALDAELINVMMGWHFAPFSGSAVEVSYPVVLARNEADRTTVETALAAKVASLNTGETPEYANAPPPPAAAPSPAPAASPALASTEPLPPPPAMAPVAPEPEPYRPPRRRRRERPPVIPSPPPVSLLTRVQERLHMDRRLGRVKAYTAGGVVTLYGKVFDDKSRRLAVATARSVDGVTDVIDNLQTDTATWAQNQSQISAQLQAAGLSQVTVKVIGHDAYLDGQVSTQAEKEHAVTVAEAAAPVRVRTNLIRVVPKGVFSF